jgi:hypothetical protein
MDKMNNQHIFTFLKKLSLLAIPLVAIVIIYILADPFKVIRNYPSFYKSGYPYYFSLNRGYVSTTTFDNYYSTVNYNSFILGNSRSMFYEVSAWKQYLDSNQKCFHFDAYSDNIYGIYKKIKYLDRKVSNINNVLLILDYKTLSGTEPVKHYLCVISPQLDNNRNLFEFHLEFLRAFYNPRFLFAFVDFKLFRKLPYYMKNIFDETPINYEPISNELSFAYIEAMIAKDESFYYNEPRKHAFYERSGKVVYSPPCIRDKQKMYLEEIKNIFQKHKTKYKIIISPLYDQIRLNQDDVNSLCEIFGKENVFDFSGINEFTSNYRNYYDVVHYRPHVALEIMSEIYKK